MSRRHFADTCVWSVSCRSPLGLPSGSTWTSASWLSCQFKGSDKAPARVLECRSTATRERLLAETRTVRPREPSVRECWSVRTLADTGRSASRPREHLMKAEMRAERVDLSLREKGVRARAHEHGNAQQALRGSDVMRMRQPRGSASRLARLQLLDVDHVHLCALTAF